jgi:Tol biopolymer transport system component
MKARWLVTWLTALVTVSCTSPKAASQSPAASNLAPASVSPSSVTPGFKVLLVTATSTANDILLYDSATGNPQRLVSLPSGAPPRPRFVSSGKIAYIDTSSAGTSRILTYDLASRNVSLEVAANGLIPAFAYNRDGSALAYLVHDATSGRARLQVRVNAEEKSVLLNAVPGRGVSRDDDLWLEFGPDGRYLMMVDTFVGNQAQSPQTGQFLVLRPDNSVAFLPPAGTSANATMGIWGRSEAKIYYRDNSGIRSWAAGVPSLETVAGGLRWYDPSPSPDGTWIAFTELGQNSAAQVKLLNLQTRAIVALPSPGRSHPLFVSSDTVWYLEEIPCVSECLQGPYRTSGKVFSYNLTTKTETVLPFADISQLSDIAQ